MGSRVRDLQVTNLSARLEFWWQLRLSAIMDDATEETVDQQWIAGRSLLVLYGFEIGKSQEVAAATRTIGEISGVQNKELYAQVYYKRSISSTFYGDVTAFIGLFASAVNVISVMVGALMEPKAGPGTTTSL